MGISAGTDVDLERVEGAAGSKRGKRIEIYSIVFLLVAMSIAATIVAGCQGKEKSISTDTDGTEPTGTEPVEPPGEEAERIFTPQELAEYNGRNGQPAFVAVDGVVYDASGSSQWAGGEHDPCATSRPRRVRI